MSLLILLLTVIPVGASADEFFIKYNDMSHFTKVPKHVRDYFNNLGCKVPQVLDSHLGGATENPPFDGKFANPNQIDWAVLCSRNGVSSIVVMWGGKSPCPSEFAQASDMQSWESPGEGHRFFSRQVRGGGTSIVEEPFLSKGIFTEYTCEGGKWKGKDYGGH